MTFAKKSLGQHFLTDKNICNKIVGLLDIQPEDALIEIGAGTGALTNIIKTLKWKSFLILEKDDRFALLHQENAVENMQVSHCDALAYPWQDIEGNIKIISNLPYNIASPLMWDIVSLVPQLEKAVFMIQNEVANRIVAQEGNGAYGALTVWLQAYTQIKKEFVVSPRAFNPPPKVDSAVISIKPLPKAEQPQHPDALSKLLKICFQQRRKQLGGILKNAQLPNYETALDELNIKTTLRPENLNVQTFIKLSEKIFIQQDK